MNTYGSSRINSMQGRKNIELSSVSKLVGLGGKLRTCWSSSPPWSSCPWSWDVKELSGGPGWGEMTTHIKWESFFLGRGDMAPVIFLEMSPPLLRFPRTFPPSSRVGPTQGFSEPQAPTVLHLLPAIWIGMAQMLWRNSKNVKWSHVFLFVLGHLHDHWTKLGGEQHAVPFTGWIFACAWHVHCPFRDEYTFHVLDLILVRCAEAVLS